MSGAYGHRRTSERLDWTELTRSLHPLCSRRLRAGYPAAIGWPDQAASVDTYGVIGTSAHHPVN